MTGQEPTVSPAAAADLASRAANYVYVDTRVSCSLQTARLPLSLILASSTYELRIDTFSLSRYSSNSSASRISPVAQ
ncbi:hypothetical protein CEP54_007427 [Fusarium duplospermum]|uniref:Uncharacterized protein n=1 Tax=Fusarium duplospermum TaxID=1325734 RepID=A0A428Q1R8_9HYPO|nr:hypothetical protein CEP54_007427 [Fusarium duplospermum]